MQHVHFLLHSGLQIRFIHQIL